THFVVAQGTRRLRGYANAHTYESELVGGIEWDGEYTLREIPLSDRPKCLEQIDGLFATTTLKASVKPDDVLTRAESLGFTTFTPFIASLLLNNQNKPAFRSASNFTEFILTDIEFTHRSAMHRSADETRSDIGRLSLAALAKNANITSYFV